MLPRRRSEGAHDANRSLDKRHRLNAGNVEASAALLAHRLVVEQHHIALRLGELGAIALVGAARQPVLLRSHDVIQLVGVLRLAPRAIQRGRPIFPRGCGCKWAGPLRQLQRCVLRRYEHRRLCNRRVRS